MKVFVLSDGIPYRHGGAQLRAYHHVRLLRQIGVESQLIAWDRDEPTEYSKGLPAYVHSLRLKSVKSSTRTRRAGAVSTLIFFLEVNLRLSILLFRHRAQFDLLHVINVASLFSLSSVPWAKLGRKTVILEMVSLGADDPLTLNRRSHNPTSQLFPHRPLKYSLFLGANAYVCKSPALLEACRQARLAEQKLHMIPSGVDTTKYSPPSPQEKARLREHLGLGKDKLVILFLGGMDEKKGVTELVEAFCQLAPQHPSSHLLIVGACSRFASTYHNVQQRIATSGFAARFTVVDKFVRNVTTYLKAADLYAHPSWREGFSMAILEAMSCGLPLVASDIAAIRDSQVEHNIQGLLVPPQNPRILALALGELLSSEALRVRLGDAARQRVLEEFTIEKATNQYLDLYNELYIAHHADT
jgi:glycosyltransferase involved in cell wall biosynthesis